MKKLTLFLVATLFSVLSFAAELNPYAYGLTSSVNGTTLTVNYSLNAPATAVSVVIMDGETEVKTIDCDGITKGSHSVDVSTLDLPTGKSLTWKVVVNGNSVGTPTLHNESIRFYLPYGMDVDVDPESDYMGNWYVIEATNGGQAKTGYQSNPFGRGLYAFDAALNPILNSAGTRGFLGGVVAGATETNINGDYVNFYRVATSGGRVFIGRFRDGASYHPIVEANPADLNANFTPVFETGRAVSIDARGSGENLKLVMLAKDNNIYEYDLGNAKSIATASCTINIGDLSILRDDATITYDNNGGIWFNQNRGTATEASPTIAHLTASGVDYNNVKAGLTHNNTNNSGIAVSPDGKQLAVVGAGTKNITIYNINNTSGNITLTKAYTFAVSAGNNHTALAWDYAGNLFAANRSSERIRIYAMPYSGTVSTPCASKYAFEVEEIVANVYTLTTNVVGEGTIEGNDGSYVEGTTATLTATPAEHYDFLNWTYGSETSTANPLTITVNSDMTVTANFQEHTKYTITAQAADNTMGYVTGGNTYYAGETVTLKAVANSTYCFVNWSDGVTDAIRTFTATADVTLTANFAKASPRAWAYDLKMVEDGDNYKFSFNATTAANATLLFLDKEGNELYDAHNVGAVAAGANTVSIEKAYFTQVKDVYWSVKMDGEAINSVAEITDQTRGIYDFYNMMGVLVDNNPNSNEFGKIYIQASINGASDGATDRSDAQKAGLFIYDQGLNELNPTSNVGIAPTVPSGYEWGAAYQFHRLAVDPKTSNLVYSYAIASKPAVFSMDRANLTGTPTNLLAGIDGFTRTVAHCFDAEGTLYIMDLANSEGTIYKIKDGVKTVFVPATGKFINQYMSMTSDGRGGLWISQNRGQLDTYYQLAHVSSAGAIDWYVNQTTTHSFTGGAVRGALAYDAERHILAQGRNSTVEVFQVAYDATTGVPTLTKIATTPQVNKANIDALTFDYAGDLYVANSGTEKFYKYTLPTDENICTVPAPESQAIIKEVRYTITVNTVGNGSATGAGEYVAGETATLEASPAANHQFVNWTYGSETSTNNPLELVVNSDITVTANFAPVQYTLIAPTNDENKGTVTGAGTYNHGAVATLTATPKEGYKLLCWSDRSTDNPRTITMTKNEAISAYFVKDYAEEPTFSIEKVWENTNVPASTSNGYQAVGWDGKIYVKERGNDKITVYLDATTSKDYAQTDNADDQSIAVDNAGNLVLRSGSTNFYDAPTQIILYKKGETTYKTIDFTLPETGRCDFISASGDLFSAEGGYVYFYCQNKTGVSRLCVKNGGATAADVTVDYVGNITTGGNTQSHVMADIFGNLVTHSRTYAITTTINAHTGETMNFTLPNNHKANALGGCSFELAGKEFWAFNVKGTNTCTSEWNLYNLTDGAFVSPDILYAKNTTDKNSAANWLNVQVVDENTAYIYQFCPTVAMAVWIVSIQRDDLQEYTVTATANDASMGSVTGGGTYYEGATAILTADANSGYRFVNWTKAGVEVSTNATYTFTVTEDVELVANFEPLPEITYELNGGVWNKYGWTSKKDMYNAFIADWKAYSGSTQYFCSYETQLGIGNSNKGLPTAILSTQPILDFMAQAKWAWLGQFLDALATAQGKATMPTANGIQMRWGLGNFFGEDNNGSTTWHGAVDCSAGQANPEAFQPIWGQSLPHPIQPTTTVVLGNPYKEGYPFDGWYAASDFSGAKVTTVDETTNGTLYAKWLEHRYTRPVTNGNYGTICLPYGSSSYNGAEFYEIAYLELQADGVTPKGIWLYEVTGALEAGKPYIFKATSTLLIVNYEGDAELNPVTGVAGLTGTFVKIEDQAYSDPSNTLEGNYMIAQNMFWLCGTGCWLDANRAYIDKNTLHNNTTPVAAIPGRRRVMMGAAGTNQATGIDHLTENGAITPTIEGTYDVLGRKFTEPNGTGFYIVNGKKVVIVK